MDTNNVVKKKEPRFYNSLLVTPLVEIFNISVNGNVNDFRVYGSIEVTDTDHTFFIYDRTKDSPQFMVSGDELFLTVEDNLDNAVIIPSEYVSLNVNLSAISGHDEITLQGEITLNRTSGLDDWSEEYITETLAGDKNWNAKVQYAIFPYAVAATVRVIHFSPDDDFDYCVVPPDDEQDDDVPNYESVGERDLARYEENSCPDITKLYGSVSAYAGKNGQMSSLFNKKQVQDCVQVQSGRYINLSRSVVAVPAYSSLKIEASFSDGNNALIANDTVEFKPVDDWQPYKKDIATGNGRIRVQVIWSSAYWQLYRNNPSGMWDSTTSYSSDDSSDDHDSFEKQRVLEATVNDDCLAEHNSSETYTSNWVLPSPTYTETLLEVFSVVVCSKDSKPFKFCGSINCVNCCWPGIVLWDASCPLECPTSGMRVSLKGPKHHEFEFMSLIERIALSVDIKDGSSQAAISRGLIEFHILDLELLADRRICSVIRGKQGFAVVHYSIFSEGVSATVEIKASDKCPPVIIKGKIYARYDNCEPGRCFHDEFFKNLLFDEDGVQLNDSEHTLPLLKSCLSLPIESILVVEVDLWVSTVDDSLAEGPKPLKGNIKFFNNGDSPLRLGNGDLCLDVSVSFSSRR
ncbi:uncharacterized protein LOC141591596 isoform X2 [Silene latifolia]|uniref:uncharacterized protein LOC141591596 isoform X2 n=1 Tax=Silene latifolia TaxID=37657 RepID=UPI003D77BA35